MLKTDVILHNVHMYAHTVIIAIECVEQISNNGRILWYYKLDKNNLRNK